MAVQTTTVANGCDAIIELDDLTGNLRDISGESNSFEIQFKNDVGDFKTFASKWRGRLTCGKDATIKLKGLWSRGANELRQMIMDWYFVSGGKKTLRVSSPDGAAGSDQFTMETVLSDFNIPMPSDDAKPIMFEINLLPDGVVNYAMI